MKCLDIYKGPGTYGIFNTVDYKWYIGSSINTYRRYKEHKKLLNKNIHPSLHFQRAYNLYSGQKFFFKVLTHTPKEDILKSEQYFIDLFGVCNPDIGYNLAPVAGNSTGRILSEETKNKISNTHKGKKLSLEHRKAISEASKGKRILSNNSIEKYRKANLGELNPYAKLTKENIFSILQMIKEGVYQKDIARKFNITRGYVSTIKRGLRWQHILN
jgi:group I intron endonuclease